MKIQITNIYNGDKAPNGVPKVKGLMTKPVLANFDKNKETVVSCDISRHGIGGVLSQYQENGTL